jgi:hypothetical protein
MRRFIEAAVLGVLVLSASACEDVTGGPDQGTTSLSFASARASAGSVSASALADSIVVGGHVINLTNVDLRLSKIEIEGDSLEIEMKGGLTVVGLPLNGGVTTPVTVPLLPGTYDKLEMEMQSVRLRGTFDGQLFDVNVNVVVETETYLNPPVVVTASGIENVTVTFSTANWFVSSTGTALDPRNLTAEGAQRLMANIKTSLHGFEDHDRDGEHDEDDDHDDR